MHDPGRQARHTALRAAQGRAEELFAEIERRGLIRPGARESEVSLAVHELARDLFGVRAYWHKRVVRAGANTLCPYHENPPDLTIAADDIVFVDLGPVFDNHEADVGRTFVLGDDPHKHRLSRDAREAWRRGKAHFDTHPAITGAELFAEIGRLAADYGWRLGTEHCGHLIGEFPHEDIQGDEVENYVHPENHVPMRNTDPAGRPREWILEVHFVDEERGRGAFVEELLTVERGA